MNNQPLENLLEEKEVAKTLHVSIGTLRTWRTDGSGPRFHRIGQRIRYAPSEVARWLASRQCGGRQCGEQQR
jgi:predicted DNA-binding transcriptional regulator AlpA